MHYKIRCVGPSLIYHTAGIDIGMLDLQRGADRQATVVESENIAVEGLVFESDDAAGMLCLGADIAEGDVAEGGEGMVRRVDGTFHAPGHVDLENISRIVDVDVFETHIFNHPAP